jgi:glycosyltransferase involved in cell wall biosynthesis
MVHANLLARSSRLLVREPVVVSTLHNQNEGGRWRYVAYGLTNRLSDVTTAVSEEAATEATRRGGAPPGAIRAVPNGVATERFTRQAGTRAAGRSALGVADEFVWLAAGRLVPEKGFDDLIAAFATVAGRSSDTRLFVAGTGPLAETLRRQAASAGVEGRLTFLGFRPDLPELMQAADAFVLSSHWEGLPMVLLEAAASSLPIVATEVAGSRAAVREGVNGFIVAPGQPASIAEAMLRLMELPLDARHRMAAASRSHAEQTFAIERVVDTWERIYREALDARSRPS